MIKQSSKLQVEFLLHLKLRNRYPYAAESLILNAIYQNTYYEGVFYDSPAIYR